MHCIKTERLFLRPFEADDLDAFYAYASKLTVGPPAGWKPHENREETLQIMGNFLREDNVWAITLGEDGRLLGSIGFSDDRKRNLGPEINRNLGYVLDDTAWGRGYATEAAQAALRYAFEELGLMLVSIQHYPFNTASRRVIEKCGFRYEGTLRMASGQFDGNIYDEVCYSMTRQEFFALYGA